MISRVGAALAQYIAPVASSQAQEQIRPHDDEHRPAEERRRKKQQPQKTPTEPAKPQAKAGAVPTGLTTSPPAAPAAPSAGIGTSSAQSFLQLLDVFQTGRGMFMRFFGSRAYQQTGKGQKKGGKFRKGTMLDERIE